MRRNGCFPHVHAYPPPQSSYFFRINLAANLKLSTISYVQCIYNLYKDTLHSMYMNVHECTMNSKIYTSLLSILYKMVHEPLYDENKMFPPPEIETTL